MTKPQSTTKPNRPANDAVSMDDIMNDPELLAIGNSISVPGDIRTVDPAAIVAQVGAFVERIGTAEPAGKDAVRADVVTYLKSLPFVQLDDADIRARFCQRGKNQLIKASDYDKLKSAVKAEEKNSGKKRNVNIPPSVLVEFTDGREPIILPVEGSKIPTDGILREIVGTDELANGGIVYVLSSIQSAVFSKRYAVCAIDYGKGLTVEGDSVKRAKRVIVTRGYEMAERTVPAKVIHEGEIAAVERPQLYSVDDNGAVKPADWSDTVRIKVTHGNGDVRVSQVAGQALRDMTSKATWMDPLGFSFDEKPTEIANVLRILAKECPTGAKIVTGMGPVTDEDGEWVYLCSEESYSPGETEYVVKRMRGSQQNVPAGLRYFGTTPPVELDDRKVKAGIKQFARLFKSSPGSPTVAVAPTANVIAAVMGTVDGDFASYIFQSGQKGSGKSYGDKLYDSIQSRTQRRINRDEPKPFLNMGQMGTTVKGGPIRFKATRGYSVSSDDVLKREDENSRTRIDKEKAVNEIIRSKEGGGGAQGSVNRATNTVGSANAGALQSNIRFSSELPMTGGSLRDRLIMPPHIDQPFGTGPFDIKARMDLIKPERIEEMHHAWSGMQWFQFFDMDLAYKILARAKDITAEWVNDGLETRVAERYASVVYGVLVFVEYANRHGVDIGDVEDYSITNLRKLAVGTQENSESDINLIRKRIRIAVTDNRGIAFPGRPACDKDGIRQSSFTSPGITVNLGTDDDPQYEFRMPPNVHTMEQLGVHVATKEASQSVALTTIGSRQIAGFLVPPLESNRSNTTEWEIYVVKAEGHLTQLTYAINRLKSLDNDPREFNEKTLEKILANAEHNGKPVAITAKKRVCISANKDNKMVTVTEGPAKTPLTCVVINTEWLFEDTDETESE